MAATEEDLFVRLQALGIATRTVRHPPVFTVAESKRLRGELPGGHCKSLFLKDKKDRLWLVVGLEDRDIDLKDLRKRIGAANLSFGKPEQLGQVLGIEPGAVTPFAVINDTKGAVTVVLDRGMMGRDLLNYHPLVNTATTAIAPSDLLAFLSATGHEPLIVEL